MGKYININSDKDKEKENESIPKINNNIEMNAILQNNWRNSNDEYDTIELNEKIEIKKQQRNTILMDINYYYNKIKKMVLKFIGYLNTRFQINKIIQKWESVFKYSIKNIKSDKLNFSIGFVSIFLVVFLVSCGLSIISQIPLIYLSKADKEAGGVDVIYRVNQNIGAKSMEFSNLGYELRLNYTSFKRVLLNQDNDNDDEYDGLNEEYSESMISPKIEIVYAYGWVSSECNGGYDIDIYNRYHYLNNEYCSPGSCMDLFCGYQTYMGFQVIDFKSQIEMNGYESTQGFDSQPEGTVLMFWELSQRLGVEIGSEIYVRIPAIQLLSTMLHDGGINDTQINDSPFIICKFKINGFYNNSDVNTKNGIKSAYLLIDYQTIYQTILPQFDPTWRNIGDQDYFSQTNLYEYAGSIEMKFPSPRLDMYQGTDLDKTYIRIEQFISKLIYKIGSAQLSIKIPVMDELYKSKDISNNLGMLLNIIVFVFLLLSVLLIYTTLMVDVETMTYNNGVLRMIGGNLKFIIMLMLSKTMIFTIPSIITGLTISQIVILIISHQFKEYSIDSKVSNFLTLNSIGYSVLLGFLIPIVSLILPTRKAIHKSLHESIDSNRSKVKTTKITIKANGRDEDFRFNISIIGFSISIFGFCVTVFLPYGLVSGNISFLMKLLFLLLIVSLVGALFLMINFHLLISKLIVLVISIFDSRAIKNIVFKNLLAHKGKNKSTIFMFGISISLIIMISSLFHVQVDSSIYSDDHYIGSYLKIENDFSVISKTNFKSITLFLDGLIDKGEIEEYSFKSIKFSRVSTPTTQVTHNSKLSNVGKTYSYPCDVIAITPNFFSPILDGYFKVSSTININDKHVIDDKDYKLNKAVKGRDLSTLLYSKDSIKKMITGSAYKKLIGANYNQPVLLENTFVIDFNDSLVYGENTEMEYLWKGRYQITPLAFMDVAATMDLSKLPSDTHQDVMVSLVSYIAFSGNNIKSVRDIPFESILIKPKSTSRDSVNSIYTLLQSFIRKELIQGEAIYVLNYYHFQDKHLSESKINSYFFDFATILSMFISSFSLISSMVTNILNQSKEIGILRSIGLSKFKIIKVYLYEAFALSFGSCILGILVGHFISYTILLEQIVITQKLLSFRISWEIIIVVFISSTFISFLSVFSPITNLLKNSIIKILKD